MSSILPRMSVVTTTPLVIHFFFKPHLGDLVNYFDLTLVYNQRSDRYLPPLNLPIKEIDIALERKIKLFSDLKSLFRLCWFFGRERMDIVVSLAPKAGLIGMFAAWLLRVPQRVHIFQGEVWAARRGPLRWLLKSLDGLTARLATHVLVVSESERCFLEGEGVIPRGKSKVLGAGSICGVDTSRFKPDPHSRERVRARLSIPERAVVCIFLGRLTVDKGVLELAKAFGQCAEQRPNLWLLIAGPDEDQMEGRLRDMVPTHLQSRAITLGYSETPEQLLAASDFLCLPSHREGFGMVVIEAAAVGIPAVGTRIHGIIDAIEDGRTGRLFDVGDVESLSQVISSWYEDPQERRRYAESAFVRVKSEFEQEVVVSRYVNFFKEISGRELR